LLLYIQCILLFLIKGFETLQGLGLLRTDELVHTIRHGIPPLLEALQSVKVLAVIQCKILPVQVAILDNFVFRINN